jgi:hypothetical protein
MQQQGDTMKKTGTLKSRVRGWQTWLLAAAMLFSGAAMAADTPAAGADNRPIDVLFIGVFSPDVRDSFWPQLQQAAARRGVRLHILGEGTAAESCAFERFTVEFLKQFHVVIYNGATSAAELAGDLPDREKVAARFRDNLDAYYRAGGGLLWSPLGHDEGGHHWNELVGKRYDVQSFNESIHDPAKMVLAQPLFPQSLMHYYVWTSAIAEHPLTKGVRGLLLPLKGEYDWPGTVPMKYGKSWTVLARGMESTRTYGSTRPVGVGNVGGGHGFRSRGDVDFTPTTQGTYESAPEIVGARDAVAGSGRMVVFPFHTAYTWLNFGNWVTGDAFMLKGAGGHPSDGFELFVNSSKWLAEPALAAGLGGYKAPPARQGRTVVPPIDWSQAAFPENSWSGLGTWWNARLQKDMPMDELVTPKARDFKGVIGLRTALSNGKGTVAEYVAEAKKLGLAYVVFLEDLTAIDDAGYAKLVAACKENSDKDFLAVPGYLYRDTLGMLYYLMNEEKLPAADNLTPERRVMTPNILNIYKGSGIAELGKKILDPWYLLSYNSIAAYVYEDGKLVDDGFAGYLSLQGRMHLHPAVALTLVREPALLSETVAKAPVTVIQAEHLDQIMGRLAWQKIWNPNPVYISGGPAIKRWGLLNPYGHPFAAGKQRTRFALEATSESGIAEAKILDARNGQLFRRFRPGGAKEFSCSIDETHKDHWFLVPVITDVNGRQAIGPTLLSIQDGNRVQPFRLFGDNIDSGNMVIGWDQKREKLLQLGAWSGGLWAKGVLNAGNAPGSGGGPGVRGFDGGGIAGSHCWVSPKVITAAGAEPRNATYRLENWQASFDYYTGDYLGNLHYLENQRRPRKGFPESSGWWAITEAPVPTEIADLTMRTRAVRPRAGAPFAANRKELTVTFKKDTELQRVEICNTWRSFDWGPMFAVAKDSTGTHAWLDDRKQNRVQRKGELGPGGYVFPGTDVGGAPVVINLGPETLSYEYSDQRFSVYLDGKGRKVKAGESIGAHFMILGKGWDGQNNTQWIDDFIADYAVGGGKPAYSFEVTQGKLREINYALSIAAENGGAAVAIGKHDLPHNLLVHVEGVAANAVVGRYDRDRKQLLILPVFENSAVTSVNTTLGDTRLYIGELFRCDNTDARLSCVQDGADKLLLEVHNPMDKELTAKLSAASGFAPLAGLEKVVAVPACSSVKLELPAAKGSLEDKAYEGD